MTDFSQHILDEIESGLTVSIPYLQRKYKVTYLEAKNVINELYENYELDYRMNDKGHVSRLKLPNEDTNEEESK